VCQNTLNALDVVGCSVGIGVGLLLFHLIANLVNVGVKGCSPSTVGLE
jgi:hypothetical protein